MYDDSDRHDDQTDSHHSNSRTPVMMGVERGRWVPLYEPCIENKTGIPSSWRRRVRRIAAEGRAEPQGKRYCCHKCLVRDPATGKYVSNRACVQKEHIYLGTPLDNLLDSVIAGARDEIETRAVESALRDGADVIRAFQSARAKKAAINRRRRNQQPKHRSSEKC